MDTFTVLADPTRRQIIELLVARGQLTATEIYDQFQSSRPAISQHLKVLREANLVTMQKRKQQHLYAFNPAAFNEMESWMQQLTRRWNERFAALDDILEEEKRKLAGGPTA
jgi:DNA-binding transcriptional ArsR family regulator